MKDPQKGADKDKQYLVAVIRGETVLVEMIPLDSSKAQIKGPDGKTYFIPLVLAGEQGPPSD